MREPSRPGYVFEGCRTVRVECGAGEICAVLGGSGPPVLLLHGYPQTHAMWHAVVPALLPHLTVVASDLRGYGDSSKPAPTADNLAYSKRAMAADQLTLMAALGHERFAVVGHDRGGRVGHRLALDHPQAVERLALLDIVPTRHMFEQANAAIALDYFHWFFLSQPPPLPERLIGSDPEFWLETMLGRFGADPAAFEDDALAEYRRCFRDPATIAASCADYRSAATIDLEHDAADAGRRIDCPVLVLWGGRGRLAGTFADPPAIWRDYAADVSGRALACGHFLPEEAPGETLAALAPFLGVPA